MMNVQHCQTLKCAQESFDAEPKNEREGRHSSSCTFSSAYFTCVRIQSTPLEWKNLRKGDVERFSEKNVQARCVFLESKKLGKCLIKGGRKAKHLLLAVIQGECHHLNDCTGLYSSRCRRRPSRFVLI